MGNMDGWAHPNVAVQPGSECVQRCGCSVECCQRLMGGGGHIVSAPTKQEGASRASVHMQGLCDLAQCAWCRLGGGWTQSSTWTFQQCTKHPQGPVWRCTCVGGQCQGMSETRNVSCPSAHGTPTDLQNGCSRGRIPAECLEQKMLYVYATVCTQGGFTLSRK